jgi:hypothetical protein
VVEHLLLQVEDLDRPAGQDPAGHLERVVAGARADLEQPLPAAGPSVSRSRGRVISGCGASTQKRCP